MNSGFFISILSLCHFVRSFKFWALSPFLLPFLLCFPVWSASPCLFVNDGASLDAYSCIGLLDGENYAELSSDGRTIRTHSYKSGKPATPLFDVSKARGASLSHINDFHFDNARKNILVRADNRYYTYDILRNRLHVLSDSSAHRNPVYSPNGRNIVFSVGHALFLKKMDYDGVVMRMTRNGHTDSVSNGIPDWLYERQLKAQEMVAWAPDNRFLAFISLNDENVSRQPIVRYPLEPLSDNGSVASVSSYYFPKAGGSIPKPGVYVYDGFYKSVKRVPLPTDGVDYIVRVTWTSDPETFAVFCTNRSQNRVRMFLVNCKSLLFNSLLDERFSSWYDPVWLQKALFLPGGRFVIPAVRDGYRQLCLYNRNGVMIQQLTSGLSDVTDVYGYDTVRNVLYYQAASESGLGRDVFSVSTKGNPTRLTDGGGVNHARFNPVYTYFVNEHSALNSPVSYEVRTAQGRLVRQLDELERVTSKQRSKNLPQRELVRFKSSLGDTLFAWVMKPTAASGAAKCPAVILTDGTPDSQIVFNGQTRSSLDDVAGLLVEHGYVVMCVDVHGCGARGESWRRGQYQKLGRQEASDLVSAARFLSAQNYVSTDRIGLYGQNYGAYLTLMGMSAESSGFKAGVAVSPQTDWRLAPAAFAERFMRRPQENGAYNQSSAIERADRLRGSLLLVHGTADDEHVIENSYAYAERLISLNKTFQMLVYPNRDDLRSDRSARRHLLTSVLSLFDRELKR